MNEVLRVNRVNRRETKRVVLNLPPPISDSLERFRALQVNPVNPNNPTQPAPLADLPTEAERWPVPHFAPFVVPLADEPPALTPEQGQALTVAVSPQPVRNIEWVCTLAERYDAARPDWPGHLCERAACLDLLAWQLETTIGDAPQSERLARVLGALGIDATPPKLGRKP